MLGMAGHDRADDNRVNASSLKLFELVHVLDVIAGEHAARILKQAAANEVLVKVALLGMQRVRNALGGAAIDLAHDDVLRDVDQTTSQVARVCGTKRGVGHTLTSAVR